MTVCYLFTTNQKPATAPLPISTDTQNIGNANTTHAVIGRVRNSLKYLQKVNDFHQALNVVWMKHYPMKNSFQVKEK